MSTASHDLLVAQNGLSGCTNAAGSYAVESSASPAPLEKAGTESSFDGFVGFHAGGSPAILEKVGCLPETSAEAGFRCSEGSHAGEPLFSLGKAEIEGDRASEGLELSNYILDPLRIGSEELGIQGGDEGGRFVCARDIQGIDTSHLANQSVLALTEGETLCADVSLGDVDSFSP